MKKLISCIVIFLSFQSPVYAPADVTEVAIVGKETQSPEIEGEWVLMEVTAYTASLEECGKTDGITASGKPVKELHTIAAGPSIPFGTKIYIPEFMKTFVVEDRGGAITDRHLDVYMEKVKDAREFGRKDIYVFVIQGDG